VNYSLQVTSSSRQHLHGRFRERRRGWKLYSFNAPEVECIGKGKANAPYEFGVKGSIVTTNGRASGGQLVLHAKALPGKPYDGHTLRGIIEETQRLTGRETERAYVDKGYRGHDIENPRRVFEIAADEFLCEELLRRSH
jgi:IS5 family transposase